MFKCSMGSKTISSISSIIHNFMNEIWCKIAGHGGEGTAPAKNRQPRVKEYGEELYYGTTKYTILDVLTNPYICLQKVIKMHFKLKKDKVLNTMEILY